MRFHTAGEAKSAIYDCLVPFNDKSMETSLRVYIRYNYYYTTSQYYARSCRQLLLIK